jgi:hypothetical protein
MRVFSYKMTNDTGFAPNPFWGYLTLATCKPRIRYSKTRGDWIAGFTSKTLCGDPVGEERLVYLMQVAEKLTFAEYFVDERFQPKIPTVSAPLEIHQVGDNIYRPITPHPQTFRDFEQLENPSHWDGTNTFCSPYGRRQGTRREHDVAGWYVLVATRFAYFGRNVLYIPPNCRPALPRGQSAHGAREYDEARAARFVDYVMSHVAENSVLGSPHRWTDDSWRLGDEARS